MAKREGDFRTWLSGLHFSGFAIVVLLLLLLTGVVLSPQLSTFFDQRRQIAQLEASVEQKRKAYAEALNEQARWQDPAYVRSEARNRLFYVMPGQNQLLVIRDVPIPEVSKPAPAPKLQKIETNWVNALAGSLLSAALTNATVDELTPAADPSPVPTPATAP